MGDSDRYLPALLYGCVPVMSDPLEALPLSPIESASTTSTLMHLSYTSDPLEAMPLAEHAEVHSLPRYFLDTS